MFFIKINIIVILFVLICINSFELLASEKIDMRMCKYNSIKMYFVNWNIITRYRLKPKDIKNMKHIYLEINNKYVACKIADKILTRNFKINQGNKPGDARLVIELYSELGKVKLFYASKRFLYTSNSMQINRVDPLLIKSLNPLVY